ncbi:unnamed protein product [Ambrosiozyma monospora]|uniref:Unnamed protein product n=1 Tax=Ambrosiozyma monospora TaxID=43982 RepID=A0ACB5TAA6_AMBMO|nr:unnamed protein product [Ambrosiozyma monospora]
MANSNSQPNSIDLYEISSNYLKRILGNNSEKKQIRVLLLDNITSSIISMFTTQSELLKNEIYLIDKLNNKNRDKLRNLKCICFLKPNDTSVTNLSIEIGSPNYLSYEIYFNNIVSNTRLERIAEADDFEMITQVAEVFIDYYIINKDVFTPVGIDNPFGFEAIDTWEPEALKSSTEALTSLLLSLKLKPTIVYESNSSMCSKRSSDVVDPRQKERSNYSIIVSMDLSIYDS